VLARVYSQWGTPVYPKGGTGGFITRLCICISPPNFLREIIEVRTRGIFLGTLPKEFTKGKDS